VYLTRRAKGNSLWPDQAALELKPLRCTGHRELSACLLSMMPRQRSKRGALRATTCGSRATRSVGHVGTSCCQRIASEPATSTEKEAPKSAGSEHNLKFFCDMITATIGYGDGPPPIRCATAPPLLQSLGEGRAAAALKRRSAAEPPISRHHRQI